jgi:hypothetical protein
MAELTPEEKKKIYEEEKERLSAQEKVKAEKKKKETQSGCIGAIILIVLIVIGLQICGFFDSGNEEESGTKTQDITLNANISFDGSQFAIKNNDTFDWTNVKLELNSGIIRGGYTLRAQLIEAGQTYTVGAMQFTKGDGTRFNPFTTKPKDIFISCDTPRGKGYYSGGWD